MPHNSAVKTDIRAQLASSKPPHLATNSARLLTALMELDASIADLAKAISGHAVIVGRLIALANSAWSSPVRTITAVDDACARLGLQVVRTAAIALAVGHRFTVVSCPTFDMKRFWVNSIVTADTSLALAARLGLDSATAKTAGLLQSVGLLWLADAFGHALSVALDHYEKEPELRLDTCVERHCGIGYREAGVILMSLWGLPSQLVAIVDTSEQSTDATVRQLRGVVHAASELASLALRGHVQLADDIELARFEQIGLEQEDLREAFAEQASRLPAAAKLGEFLVER